MVDELDAYLRHQVYLEGFKNGQVNEGEATFEEIAAVIALLLNRLGVETIGDISRRRLNGFIAEVNRRVKAIFDKTGFLSLDNIKKFAAVENRVSRSILSAVSGKAAKGLADPYTKVMNEPIAGTGIEPKTVLASMGAGILIELGRLIRRGYAERWTIPDFMRKLVGTRLLNRRDGLIARLQRSNATAVQTLIQHVSSAIMFNMMRLQYDRYQWIAVLDSRTTDICRERNGNVYEFRNGPRPPAHYNCRSTIIPVILAAARVVPTFWPWLNTQPDLILADLIGSGRARRLRDGDLTADDFPGFDGMRPLTLQEFEDSLPQMVA